MTDCELTYRCLMRLTLTFQANLIKLAIDLFDALFSSVSLCPSVFKVIFYYIRKYSTKYFPTQPSVWYDFANLIFFPIFSLYRCYEVNSISRTYSICSFLCLRLLVPALIDPTTFDVIPYDTIFLPRDRVTCRQLGKVMQKVVCEFHVAANFNVQIRQIKWNLQKKTGTCSS